MGGGAVEGLGLHPEEIEYVILVYCDADGYGPFL